MQVTVKHKFIHQAPRKLRYVSDMVRGLPAKKAVEELSILNRGASLVIRKLITAGIAAAADQGLNMASACVGAIMVDEGPKLRRFITMSRGRSQRILKRMSHVMVTITDEPVTTASSRAYKKESIVKSAIKPAKRAQPAAPVTTSETPELPAAAKGSK